MNNTQPPAKKPFSLFKTDRAKRILVAVKSGTAPGLNRFGQFQRWCVDHKTKLTDTARALAMLLAETGVASESDLPHVYAALARPFECEGQVLIEWENPGCEMDRRELGIFMINLMPRVKSWPIYEEALGCLLEALASSSIYPDEPRDALLGRIIEDAQAFARLAVPTALFAHVLNHAKFTALPRSCLARLSGKMPLAPAPQGVPAQPQSTDDGFDLALDAALLGRAALGSGSPASFARRLEDALRPGTGSVASQRAGIATELCTLAPAATELGTAACLLYCYAIELFSSGRYEVSTPYDYVRPIAVEFLQLFAEVDFSHLKGDKYEELILALRGTAPESRRSAAVTHLHHFLTEWDLVPPLPAGTLAGQMQAVVRANVIHEHEIATLFEWVGDAELTRLHEMLPCALGLLTGTKIRIGELLWLRLEGIRLGVVIEIDIAPRLSDPSNKSAASRRRAKIDDPRAVAVITKWVNRRLDEERRNIDGDPGLQPPITGYLFGDPNRPNCPYRPGALARLLNLLLKSVTGDLTVSVHTFRHTHGSASTSATYASETAGETSAIDLAGSAMGHASGQTILEAYSHLFERPMRVCWDRYWHSRLELTSLDVAFWTGQKDTTVRKRPSRLAPKADRDTSPAGRAKQKAFLKREYLHALRNAAAKREFEPAHKHIQLGIACIPLRASAPATIGLAQVVHALSDLANGYTMAQVALRQELSQQGVHRILIEVANLSDRMTGRRTRTQSDVVFGVEALRDSGGDKLGFRPDFARLDQPRWRHVRHWLGRHIEDPVASSATRFWLSVARRDYIPLRPGEGAIDLLKMFRLSETNLSLLQLCTNGRKQDLDKDNAHELTLLELHAQEALGQPIRTVHLSQRRGRPMFYLTVGEAADSGDDAARQGAGQSIVGLHCLLACAYLSQKTRTP